MVQQPRGSEGTGPKLLSWDHYAIGPLFLAVMNCKKNDVLYNRLCSIFYDEAGLQILTVELTTLTDLLVAVIFVTLLTYLLTYFSARLSD